MATVTATLRMFDQFTRPLRQMTTAMNTTISAMERMNEAGNRDASITRQMEAARNSIRQAEVAFRQVEEEQRRIANQQNNVNNAIRQGTGEANGLLSTIKSVAATYLGWQAVKKGIDLVIGGAAKLQRQLITIGGMLGDKAVGKAFFQQLDDYATISQYKLQEYASISRQFIQFTKNTDKLMGLNKLAERLAFLDPTQGLEGAGFALKEILGGDGMSLKGRFGFGSAEIKQLKSANNMDEFMKMFSDMLSAKGGTPEAVAEAAGSALNAFENLIANITTKFSKAGEQALEYIKPILMALNQAFREGQYDTFFAGIALGFSIVTNTIIFFIDIAVWGIDFIFQLIHGLGIILLGLFPIILGLAGAWAAYNVVVFLSGVFTTAYALATNGAARALAFAALKQKALNLVMGLNPIGIVIGLIVGLISAMAAFGFITNGVRETFSKAFGFIVDVAERSINAVIGILNAGIKGINKVSGFFSNLLGVDAKQIQEIEFKADFQSFKEAGQDLIENATLDDIKAKFGLDKLGDSSMLAEQNDLLEKWNSQQNDNFGLANDTLKKTKDSIDISNEDLKVMRELAEMKNIQNFVTLTPTVSVQTGDITEGGFDIDTVITRITDSLINEVASSAEGVFA